MPAKSTGRAKKPMSAKQKLEANATRIKRRAKEVKKQQKTTRGSGSREPLQYPNDRSNSGGSWTATVNKKAAKARTAAKGKTSPRESQQQVVDRQAAALKLSRAKLARLKRLGKEASMTAPGRKVKPRSKPKAPTGRKVKPRSKPKAPAKKAPVRKKKMR